MKYLSRGVLPLILTLTLTLAALPAIAQTATNGVRQQRAITPAQRAQTPATPVTVPATAIRQDATTLQTNPVVAAGGKQLIPANLFSVEDRAIIIVGGKPVAAGDVKRQLVNEMRQQSVPGTWTYRRANTANMPAATPVRELPGGPMGNVRQPRDRIEATTRIPGVGGNAMSRDSIKANPALSYNEMLNYCKTHPAEISRVRGTVTPNARFRIEGICFGDQTGAVEAIGQFPGGNMRLVFERWTDSEITAFVPPVSGAVDHAIALTVVRLDKTRSPAMQARFIATRQQVPVPPRLWNPGADFIKIEVDQGGGNIFSGYTVWGAGSASRSTPFSLLINSACELDSASWASRTGRVEAFNGWENGPPNHANVEIVWTPRCTTQTTNYVFASSSQRICSIDFSVAAVANCPVGLTP
jgi:hypothetical protein